MTLGNVYDLDLKKNESLIKEVIIQAQGEVMCSTGLSFITLIYYRIDGSGRVRQTGEGVMDQLHFGIGQLPEQVPTDKVSLPVV